MRSVFIIFLLLLLVAGCDSIVESDFVTATGYIKKLDDATYRYGTHKLVDSNGNILYILSSDEYELDYYRYMETRIEGKIKHISLSGPEWVIVSYAQPLVIY